MYQKEVDRWSASRVSLSQLNLFENFEKEIHYLFKIQSDIFSDVMNGFRNNPESRCLDSLISDEWLQFAAVHNEKEASFVERSTLVLHNLDGTTVVHLLQFSKLQHHPLCYNIWSMFGISFSIYEAYHIKYVLYRKLNV
jgi:hypothetical protein